MNTPLISIIIPTYNRAELLIETLESVKNQTYNNWECIIVDDGSTDNTENLVAEYISKDTRFKFFKRPECHSFGGNGARNFGFIQSTGEYVKWLDSDDLITSEILEIESKIIRDNLGCVDLFVCIRQNFDNNNSGLIADGIMKEQINNGDDILVALGKHKTFNVPGCYLVRREVILRAGLWNESVKLNQDGEFFTRVCVNSKSAKAIKEVGLRYRTDGNDKLMNKKDLAFYENRLKSWCLIKSFLENESETKFESYLQEATDSMFYFLFNKMQWKLILKYRYLFNKQIESNSRLKMYYYYFRQKIIFSNKK